MLYMHSVFCILFALVCAILLYLLVKCRKNEKFADDYMTLDDDKEGYSRLTLNSCFDECPNEKYCVDYCSEQNNPEHCMRMCREESQCVTGCLYRKCNGDPNCVANMK